MTYKTKGICAFEIGFDIEEDNIVRNVEFKGGCDGNHKGLCSLVDGMDIDRIISKLDGIKCGQRNSSCPDQLAKALKEYKTTS